MPDHSVRSAPAKINLYLHVTGRRDDGYHLLDTLIAFAGIGDEVTATAADDLTLEIDGPFADSLAAERDNLVLRAARSLALHGGVQATAALTLTKRLPVASGIGGGSADAAAALLALAELWQLDISPSDLAKIGLALGADVPICLAGHAALVSGIGETIGVDITLPSAWLVLANPGIGVSTPAVFRALSLDGAERQPPRPPPPDRTAFIDYLAERTNDLAAPATRITPEIGILLTDLSNLSGVKIARMSGSGATCFALFDDEQAARRGADQLSNARPNWWVSAAPLLSKKN